jgi:hypothetical protein
MPPGLRLLVCGVLLAAAAAFGSPPPAAAPPPAPAPASPEAPKDPPPPKPAGTLKILHIENPRFTPAKIASLHEVEAEKIANFLAVYAWREWSEQVRSGSAAARIATRRHLSLAYHLCPANVAARRINELLSSGNELSDALPLPTEPKLFIESTVEIIQRLKASGQPEEKALAGYLSLVAAEIDPSNEEVIYHAEVFARQIGDISQAWKELATNRPQP